MKIKSIKEIKPEMSHCISVGSSDKLFAIGEKGTLLTHNSVAQRNIIFSCLLRPDKWVLLGIDLKRVELTQFKKYGVNVAVDLSQAVDFLRFAQAVMMKRYERMEQSGVNDFQDLPVPGQALMVMIDEAGELLSPSGSKALSENTLINTPKGLTTLKNINVGDVIYDRNSELTRVVNKYEPVKQQHFKMTISNDESHQKEQFIAGKEHLWVVSIKYPNGNIKNNIVLDTVHLYDLINQQKKLPKADRIQLKISKKE
jgi:ABC-type antimicrobial peptide transport system permease subunit